MIFSNYSHSKILLQRNINLSTFTQERMESRLERGYTPKTDDDGSFRRKGHKLGKQDDMPAKDLD